MDKDEKHKDEKPKPGDDAYTALEKSGSVDERVPDAAAEGLTRDGIIVGAPASYAPGMAGLGRDPRVDLGEGEAVLENERKAQRAEGNKQRG